MAIATAYAAAPPSRWRSWRVSGRRGLGRGWGAQRAVDGCAAVSARACSARRRPRGRAVRPGRGARRRGCAARGSRRRAGRGRRATGRQQEARRASIDAARRRRRAGRRARGPRCRPGARRDRGLDQLGPDHDGLAPRQGRPRRVLDLRLHQLHPRPAVREAPGTTATPPRACRRRRPHPRAVVRTRARQRPGRRGQGRDPLPGRRRSVVRDLERLPERRTGRRSTSSIDPAASGTPTSARATTTAPSR